MGATRKCLRCGSPLHPQLPLFSTGGHRPWCAWNFYYECPACHYQNNLAKLIDAACSCDLDFRNIVVEVILPVYGIKKMPQGTRVRVEEEGDLYMEDNRNE